MKRYILICAAVVVFGVSNAAADNNRADTSTKRERNLIRSGNAHFEQGRFSEAEKDYAKALEANPMSEVAQYDYALSIIRQAGAQEFQAAQQNPDNPLSKALQQLSDLESAATNDAVAENSAYNLGNVAFNNSDFKGAIEHYKRTLRRNPDNDLARENLRLAQQKLQEQQNQDQNQDDKQDQQQQQDQDQNQQQQQQDQNQNQDQNQDQDQNKDEQQNQQQQQPNKPGDDKQDQQQQQQGGISAANAQKILDTVDKAESATRAKVDAEKKKEEMRAAGRPTGNQW